MSMRVFGVEVAFVAVGMRAVEPSQPVTASDTTRIYGASSDGDVAGVATAGFPNLRSAAASAAYSRTLFASLSMHDSGFDGDGAAAASLGSIGTSAADAGAIVSASGIHRAAGDGDGAAAAANIITAPSAADARTLPFAFGIYRTALDVDRAAAAAALIHTAEAAGTAAADAGAVAAARGVNGTLAACREDDVSAVLFRVAADARSVTAADGIQGAIAGDREQGAVPGCQNARLAGAAGIQLIDGAGSDRYRACRRIAQIKRAAGSARDIHAGQREVCPH